MVVISLWKVGEGVKKSEDNRAVWSHHHGHVLVQLSATLCWRTDAAVVST
jgi:hypothetical protein